MNQCVPCWDLADINSNQDVFKLGYEVAELTWENGQVAMHELGHRRVPSKSQPETSWDNDQPRAGETLEAIVNQATHQPYCKTHVAVDDNELVPSATMTSDALVPHDAGCSTRVGSCNVGPINRKVACDGREGGCTTASCRDMTVSGCGTYETFDTYDGDTGGHQRLVETSTESPEYTSSGGDWLKSRSPDDSVRHCRTK
nr:Myc-type, basic helix-loop-helix (bHLH) domain-containing protein [Tanacetum cinerariifolium]